jgi:hypothetical protein
LFFVLGAMKASSPKRSRRVCTSHCRTASRCSTASNGWLPRATVLTLDAKWKPHSDYPASLASKYRGNVKNRVLAPIDAVGF